jgi:hypothetical protein
MAGPVKQPTAATGRPQGSIALELALLLPLYLLIIAGALDLGLLFWSKNILTNASREGARAAALAGVSGAPDKTKSQVMQLVQNYLDKSGLKDPQGNHITLSMDGNFFYGWDTSGSPGKLWVELKTIPVKMLLLPDIGKLYGGEITPSIVDLTARTTMGPEWTTTPLP